MDFAEALICRTKLILCDHGLSTLETYPANYNKNTTIRRKTAMEFTEAWICGANMTLRDHDLSNLESYRAKFNKHPTNRQKTTMDFIEALVCLTKTGLRDDDLNTLENHRAKSSKQPNNRQKTAMRDLPSQKQQNSTIRRKTAMQFTEAWICGTKMTLRDRDLSNLESYRAKSTNTQPTDKNRLWNSLRP